MKWTAIFALGIASGIALSVVSIFVWKTEKMTKVHVLKQPMLVSSNTAGKVLHLLPVGTTLYFDKSYPEGFTRYKVYINVDRMPLPLRDLADPNEIDPLEARAFDKSDMVQALRDYPLTRQQLGELLHSRRLTKQEIREVLEEYLDENK